MTQVQYRPDFWSEGYEHHEDEHYEDEHHEDYQHRNRLDEEFENRRHPRPRKWSENAEQALRVWAASYDEGYVPNVYGRRVIDSNRDFNKETWRSLEETWGSNVFVSTGFDWKLARALLDQALAESSSVPRFEVRKAIEESKRILDFKDDWDEQGSVAYTREVWEAAVGFLAALDTEMDALGKKMEIPKISPGPEGSIDLHWKTGSFELLMKVPPDDGPVTFYGDDYGKNQFEGNVGIDDPPLAALVLLKFAKA